MNNDNSNVVCTEISLFTTEHRKEQELHLLKYALLFKENTAEALGPLDQPPLKTVHVPFFVSRERIADSGDCYVLLQGDQQGESKIDRFGKLLGNRHFLFSSFCLSSRPRQVYVLLGDLLKCLGVSLSCEQFLQQHQQLLGVPASPEEVVALKQANLISGIESDQPSLFVTAKSVFMLFGARVILGGARLVDDYWEELAKEQGFSPHSRVFFMSAKILKTLEQLKPTVHADDNKDIEEISSEPPYVVISEQMSPQVRQEYARQLAQGERQELIIPGQNIVGSLELSAQSKLPKYHSKISLQAATQMGIHDTPIGTMPLVPTAAGAPSHSEKIEKESADNKRDALVIAKVDKGGLTQWVNSGIVAQDVSLNINGWKFDSLPVKSTDNEDLKFSIKGLPLYDSTKLAERLKRLTPSEINEMQHIHDAVYLNTKLQNARKIRKTRWTKYWQHKAGLPIGLTDQQCGRALDKYFEEAANHVDVVRSVNTALGKEEVKYMRRIPNANYKGHCNIAGVKPPYINE
ncbi:LAFA_0A00364g1_1 [Lachancea sp. 'fantastica']|nr:LAFA_0A00364g1_1 [Lachancea sp. 'fantastica']